MTNLLLQLSGYVDTNTFEVGVTDSIAGVNLGNIFGNLKDGIAVRINLQSMIPAELSPSISYF